MKAFNIHQIMVIVYILIFFLNKNYILTQSITKTKKTDLIYNQRNYFWSQTIIKKISDSLITKHINIIKFRLPIDFTVDKNGQIIIDGIYFQNKWLTSIKFMEWQNKLVQEDSLLLEVGKIAITIIQNSHCWNIKLKSQLFRNEEYEYLFYAEDGVLYLRNTGIGNKCGFPKK